ncbi:MAG: UbiA family prenyltransferase [Candidatus Methanospirareceae archaeon]
MSVRVWFKETRPKFLLLTPVCVFTGVAASLYDGYQLNVLHLLLAFIGALAAHISVNVLNDYFDFKSGIDLKTVRTPFSGGSGILPEGLLEPERVFLLGVASLCVVISVGVYFFVVYGLALLPIAIAGILLVYLYTPIISKVPAMSEPAAGGFALMVLGTYFTQTGTYSVTAIVVTLVAGLLIANLLLLNEFPDVEADRAGGRKHLPIMLGTAKAAKVYCLIIIASYALVVWSVISKILPFAALLGLVTLPLGIKAMKGALKEHNNREKLIPALGMNVFVVLLTPFFMSVGIIIANYM